MIDFNWMTEERSFSLLLQKISISVWIILHEGSTKASFELTVCIFLMARAV